MQYIVQNHLNSLNGRFSDSSANIETQKKPPKIQHKPRTNQSHTTYFCEESETNPQIVFCKLCIIVSLTFMRKCFLFLISPILKPIIRPMGLLHGCGLNILPLSHTTS
ncbi:6505_t:CDS:2 [Gigaspora rosea]|nr:6505_t:CDS:2 [Gigaspora rosea]